MWSSIKLSITSFLCLVALSLASACDRIITRGPAVHADNAYEMDISNAEKNKYVNDIQRVAKSEGFEFHSTDKAPYHKFTIEILAEDYRIITLSYADSDLVLMFIYYQSGLDENPDTALFEKIAAEYGARNHEL